MLTARCLQRLALAAGLVAAPLGCSSRGCRPPLEPLPTAELRVFPVQPAPDSPDTYIMQPDSSVVVATAAPTQTCEPSQPVQVSGPFHRVDRSAPAPSSLAREAAQESEATDLDGARSLLTERQPAPLPEEEPQALPASPKAASSVAREALVLPSDALVTCARAVDYSWVVGELRYHHARGCWQVRFAPVSVEDMYGGAFCLEAVDHLVHQFKDGMIVKVEGVVVDPDKHRPSPNYWVNNVVIVR